LYLGALASAPLTAVLNYKRNENPNSALCASAGGGWLFTEDAATESQSERNIQLGAFDTPEA
jgi:hypothetical protein